MKTEARTEIEAHLRGLHARQAVLEIIQTQFMLQMIHVLAERPPDFLRHIMIGAEDSLRAGLKTATGEERDAAEAAVAYFEEYSGRLIAALTPKSNRQ